MGEKKYLRVEESRYRLQGLRRAALSAAALSAAGRAPFAPRHAARAGARPACRVRARGSSRRRSRGHTHWERSHQRARRRETPPEAGMLHAGGGARGGLGGEGRRRKVGGERGEGRGGGRGRGAVGVGGGWESEEVERKLCTPAVSSATEGPRGYIPRPGCIVSASTAEPKSASRTHARECASEAPSPSAPPAAEAPLRSASSLRSACSRGRCAMRAGGAGCVVRGTRPAVTRRVSAEAAAAAEGDWGAVDLGGV